jgi:hypothetical protein
LKLARVFAQGAGPEIAPGPFQGTRESLKVGAQVELRRLSTNEVFRTLSTETGDYTVGDLPIDTYDLRVSPSGFNTEVRTGIRLEVGRTGSHTVHDLTVTDFNDATPIPTSACLVRLLEPRPSA